MAPVYITNLYGSPNTIYYIPAGATWTGFFYNYSTETFGASRTGDGYIPVLNTMASCTIPPYVVTSQIYNIPAGGTTYVHSINRNSYPDSGTVDGLTYKYLGVPFQNAITATTIATGSYTGTGTYGEANKNVLKLDFEPKLVFLSGVGIGDHGYALSGQSIFNHWNTGNYDGNTQLPHGCSCEFNGNEFKYYNGSQAAYQFNISGRAYNYVAFG